MQETFTSSGDTLRADSVVWRACRYIEQNWERSLTLADIGAHVGMSPFHLQRIFKRALGVTPKQYAEGMRINCLKARLRNGTNVTDAIYDVGFGSSSRVYERADAHLGMTPATYSRGGKGMLIHYTICRCHLGLLLVGMTERGVCAVHLGTGEDELIAQLHREYPLAVIERNHNHLCDWVQQIIEYLNGWQTSIDCPLDVQATSFQLRVWHELRRIPYGETRTYQEIAQALGKPNAASAVAAAVEANPVAVLIPCHRAAREDGEVTTRYSARGRASHHKLRTQETIRAGRQQSDKS